jgi:hypothetical protein
VEKRQKKKSGKRSKQLKEALKRHEVHHSAGKKKTKEIGLSRNCYT